MMQGALAIATASMSPFFVYNSNALILTLYYSLPYLNYLRPGGFVALTPIRLSALIIISASGAC